MNLSEKSTVKPYSILFFDTTLASNNYLHFWPKISEIILKLIMTIDGKTEDEKRQNDTNREAAKILTL